MMCNLKFRQYPSHREQPQHSLGIVNGIAFHISSLLRSIVGIMIANNVWASRKAF